MAQLLVRNLDPETKERLRKRAALNSRSMEAEARLILKLALIEPIVLQEEGLGTQTVKMFEGVGMDFELPEDEYDIPFEFPGE
jgi:plasmid stability protein